MKWHPFHSQRIFLATLATLLLGTPACDFSFTNSSGVSTTQQSPIYVKPVVMSVAPATGAVGGGTQVAIFGSNFISGAAVWFGGQQAPSVNVVSSTEISAMTPPGSDGSIVSVTVVNVSGTSGSEAGAFTYSSTATATLSVSSLSPNSGPSEGGTPITLTGTGFEEGLTVSLGTATCNNVTVVSPQSAQCTTTAGGAGSVNVVVQNPDQSESILPAGFTYQSSSQDGLTLTSVSPNVGPSAGNTLVSLIGTGFAGNMTATFGGQTCTSPVVVSSTVMTCLTPASSTTGAVDVKVSSANGQVADLPNGFTFQSGTVAAPAISSVTLGSTVTSGGYPATIQGSNFAAGATVTFGGSAATSVQVTSASSITCVVPVVNQPTVTITVTNPNNASGSFSFTNTEPVTQPAPTLTSITPNSGPTSGGTTVTLAGTNFVSGTTVQIDGMTASSINVINSTSITCVTPSDDVGAVDVTVINPDQQQATLSSGFTYSSGNPAPTIASLSPTSGPANGGTTVMITGTNFLSGATVDFDGIPATSVMVVGPTGISCVTPADSAGAVDVTVTNPDQQQATLSGGFTYNAANPAPTLSGITPNSGPLAGGTKVTLTGTNFASGATVQIDGNNAGSVQVVNATTITCVTPADGSAGVVDVTVTNADQQQATLPSSFSYNAPPPPPSVNTVGPSQGTPAGGTPITISGSGFVVGSLPTFDGVPAGNINVVSATVIQCTTPAHASGDVNVVVSNPDGQASDPVDFTYAYPAPVVSGINPNSGYSQGGNGVTITGANFLSGATVMFNGSVSAGSVNVASASTITCIVPAGSAGAVDVTVTNPDQQQATLSGGYTYVDPVAASVAINVNGAGDQLLYTDQPATIYWASANATYCEVDWAGGFLTSGLSGAAGSPAQDYVNDDTFTLTCNNPIGVQTSAQVSVSRMAYAVGETRYAHYVLSSQADANLCAQNYRRSNSACAPYVRVGRTRDVINQGGIAFDDPHRCKCSPGGQYGTYNWY